MESRDGLECRARGFTSDHIFSRDTENVTSNELPSLYAGGDDPIYPS